MLLGCANVVGFPECPIPSIFLSAARALFVGVLSVLSCVPSDAFGGYPKTDGDAPENSSAHSSRRTGTVGRDRIGD